MYALVTSTHRPTPRSETVEAVLRPAHDAFRTFVGPALEPDTDVWTRWRDTLPAEGATLLAHLESATQWH